MELLKCGPTADGSLNPNFSVVYRLLIMAVERPGLCPKDTSRPEANAGALMKSRETRTVPRGRVRECHAQGSDAKQHGPTPMRSPLCVNASLSQTCCRSSVMPRVSVCQPSSICNEIIMPRCGPLWACLVTIRFDMGATVRARFARRLPARSAVVAVRAAGALRGVRE